MNNESKALKPKVIKLTFPGSDAVVRAVVTGSVMAEDFLEVQLHRTQRTLTSTFVTTNERSDHLVPTLISRSCPTCGQQTGEMVPPENTTVTVIGPIKELAETERGRIEQEIRDKVKSYSSYWGRGHRRCDDYDDYDYDARYRRNRTMSHEEQGRSEVEGDDYSTGLVVVPYKLCRRGRLVAEIDPALIEQAGATIEGFAQALGWKPADAPPSKKEERGDSDTASPCD